MLARRINDLLNDLQQLDRAPRGEAILDAFTRHTAFDSGAVYLREGTDTLLHLAAKSGQTVAPEILETDPPSDLVTIGDRVLIPLRTQREHLGLIELTGAVAGSEEDLDLLRAAAMFLCAVMTNQRLTQEAREGDFQLKYRLWELESL